MSEQWSDRARAMMVLSESSGAVSYEIEVHTTLHDRESGYGDKDSGWHDQTVSDIEGVAQALESGKKRRRMEWDLDRSTSGATLEARTDNIDHGKHKYETSHATITKKGGKWSRTEIAQLRQALSRGQYESSSRASAMVELIESCGLPHGSADEAPAKKRKGPMDEEELQELLGLFRKKSAGGFGKHGSREAYDLAKHTSGEKKTPGSGIQRQRDQASAGVCGKRGKRWDAMKSKCV